MTDKHRSAGELVERLRKQALPDPSDEREVMHADLLREAADRIATLEQKLAKYEAAEKSLPLGELIVVMLAVGGKDNLIPHVMKSDYDKLVTIAAAAIARAEQPLASAAAAMKERCAKVCDAEINNWSGTPRKCAAAIRALPLGKE